MGLCGGQGRFMAIMNELLTPFINKFVHTYLDDILIYSRTVDARVGHVISVLKSLRAK